MYEASGATYPTSGGSLCRLFKLSRVSTDTFSFVLTAFADRKPEIIVEKGLRTSSRFSLLDPFFLHHSYLGCTSCLASKLCKVVEQLSLWTFSDMYSICIQ